MPETEKYITLGDCIEIINKRKLLVILITVISVIIAGVINYIIPPTYEAKTSVVVGKTNSDKDLQTQYSDILMYQNMVTTYAKIAQSINVAEETASELHNESTYSNITADDITNILTVEPEKDTQIIDISVRCNNAEQAKTIVNVLTDSFIDEAKRIYPSQDIQVMDSARIPKSPVTSYKKLTLVIAFALGFIVSIVIAILLEKANNSIKSEEDAEEYLGLPVLGIIPYAKIMKS